MSDQNPTKIDIDLSIIKKLCTRICGALEIILERNNSPLKEYDLLKELSSDRFSIFPLDALRDTHKLYQIHFLTFHCLHQLQARYLQQKKYHLHIHTLRIQRIRYQSRHNMLPTLEHDSTSDYYLDLNNLINTSQEDVQNLLNTFWDAYIDWSSIKNSLAILEININRIEEIEMTDVKRNYKKLALLHHPDRGGSHEKIIEINRAYKQIKQFLKHLDSKR